MALIALATRAAPCSAECSQTRCRYLGQLLDDVDEADAAYCTGIELLKRDIDTAVCAFRASPCFNVLVCNMT